MSITQTETGFEARKSNARILWQVAGCSWHAPNHHHQPYTSSIKGARDPWAACIDSAPLQRLPIQSYQGHIFYFYSFIYRSRDQRRAVSRSIIDYWSTIRTAVRYQWLIGFLLHERTNLPGASQVLSVSLDTGGISLCVFSGTMDNLECKLWLLLKRYGVPYDAMVYIGSTSNIVRRDHRTLDVERTRASRLGWQATTMWETFEGKKHSVQGNRETANLRYTHSLVPVRPR